MPAPPNFVVFLCITILYLNIIRASLITFLPFSSVRHISSPESWSHLTPSCFAVMARTTAQRGKSSAVAQGQPNLESIPLHGNKQRGRLRVQLSPEAKQLETSTVSSSQRQSSKETLITVTNGGGGVRLWRECSVRPPLSWLWHWFAGGRRVNIYHGTGTIWRRSILVRKIWRRCIFGPALSLD